MLKRLAGALVTLVGLARLAAEVIGYAGLPDDLSTIGAWMQEVRAWLLGWEFPPRLDAGDWLTVACIVVGLLLLTSPWRLLGGAEDESPAGTRPEASGSDDDLASSLALYRPGGTLEHDGVLWQDRGHQILGRAGLRVDGPLCPVDQATLFHSSSSLHMVGNRLQSRPQARPVTEATVIGADTRFGLYSELVCPECGATYQLGASTKRVSDSCAEVRGRFEGQRRRAAR